MVWGSFGFFSFSLFWLLALNWGQADMSNWAASVDKKPGRNHLFLSRGSGKGTPAFQKVWRRFLFSRFLHFSSSIPDSGPALVMALHCHHCDEVTFTPREDWVLGKRNWKKGPLWSKECEEIPLFFFLVSLFPLFWRQRQLCGTVKKHRRLALHLSGQRNWEKQVTMNQSVVETPERKDWRWGFLN